MFLTINRFPTFLPVANKYIERLQFHVNDY